MTSEDIIILLNSPATRDIELIQKAYDFALKAHEGQLRKSGEPYFIHVFETAKILANLKMGTATIIAGLLHDSTEDGIATEESIKNIFGEEVLFLVNGVTKMGKMKYGGTERHAESLQKFLVAMAKDIRVLVLKLADRLHNMRTLQYLQPDKQHRIALETLKIYAPLAYRLSIRALSRELEDLSFQYVYPEEFLETKNILRSKKEQSVLEIDKFIKSVKKALAREDIINFKTNYRHKGIYSLYRKLETHNKDTSKIYDVLAIRIVVGTIPDCYRVLGIIHSLAQPLPGRIKDYIAFPKSDGYQSLHTTVMTRDGETVEVQIRTFKMHGNSEFGTHILYKGEASLKRSISSNTRWFKQLLPSIINFFEKPKTDQSDSNLANGLVESQEYIRLNGNEFSKDSEVDFFSDRIFILTPKSDVLDLPRGSSTIDFAYAIHSSVGDHTSGAIINGKLVSLDTTLNNGDVVEIITKESSKPSPKWLEIVKTNMAKRHISSWLDKNQKQIPKQN